MKNLVTLSIFSCLLLTGTLLAQTIEELSSEAYQIRLEKEKNAQLIDVRKPEEYKGGHIENAVNINFYDEEFKTKIEKLNKDLPVYVYCAAGGRSGKTAKMLQAMEFKIVYDLSGGYQKWISEKKEPLK